MPKKRNPRVDQAVKEAIAELLEQEIADPRLSFVTITDVRVTEDHRYATVYYTTLDPALLSHAEGTRAADADEAAEGLRSATPRLQGLLARRVRLRHTPALTFEPDPVAVQARRIDQLLRGVRGEGPDAGDATTGGMEEQGGRDGR